MQGDLSFLDNSPLHVWKGYTRFGYWSRMYASLNQNFLVISESPEGSVRYRILLRLLKIKRHKREQFSITYGLKTLYFKCLNRALRDQWVNGL